MVHATSNRLLRNGVSIVVALVTMLGVLTLASGEADAQTFTIPAPATESHSARCYINLGGDGGITISSSFSGPPHQQVAFRYHFWRQNTNGTWSRVYTGEPWRFTSTGSAGTAWVSNSFTLPGGKHTPGHSPYFESWWVHVESYRKINGMWTHRRETNATPSTPYKGRLYDGCFT